MSSLLTHRKLIARLSLDAHQSPRAYRRKAMLAVASGPLHLAGLFGGCLLAALIGFAIRNSAFGVLGKTMVVLAILAAVLIARALWVEMTEPDGHPVLPTAAPKLWELLGKLSRKLHAPPIDAVRVDEFFGVRIEHFHRWIVFGPRRYVLVIGMPWLMALSPKQASAGIAQVMALHGERGGGEDAWFSRTREFWPRYVASLPEDAGLPDRWVYGVLARAMPNMLAWTLPMAHDMVLKADAAAAACMGVDRCAQAIVREAAIGRWLEEYFWPSLLHQADMLPEPDRMPFASLIQALHTASTGNALRRTWERELRRKHPPEHPVPGVADRLRALGQSPELTGMPERTAAEHLLGEAFKELVRTLDAEWLERERPVWRQRHEEVQQARLWLANFGHGDPEKMSIETLTTYARALLTVGERARALPLLRRAADHPEGTAETAWDVAQIMLEHDDMDALNYLDLVMERDAFRALEAAELALDIAERHARRERVGHYRRIVDKLAA